MKWEKKRLCECIMNISLTVTISQHLKQIKAIHLITIQMIL